MIKSFVKEKLGFLFLPVYKILLIFQNYFFDMMAYLRFSSVFGTMNEFNRIESHIIIYYHSLEKGMLHDERRVRFGKAKIETILKFLKMELVLLQRERSQLKQAALVLTEYYSFHSDLNVSINDYFNEDDFNFLKHNYLNNFNSGAVIKSQLNDFYANVNSNFQEFSQSRKSIRDFSDVMVSREKILDAVKLASTSPSVCNRQTCKIYLIEDKKLVRSVLKVQGGLTGYMDTINQILILTSDRKYFYSIGERNQYYVDGGIFLMNLLYCLHYFKIACCPANWAKTYNDEKLILDKLKIPKSEKVICLVAIGNPNSEVVFTMSKRRDINEYFKIID